MKVFGSQQLQVDVLVPTWVNKWQHKISKQHPQCERLISLHFQSILQLIFEQKGKNLSSMLKCNERISHRQVKQVESEFEKVITVFRTRTNPDKRISAQNVTGIPHHHTSPSVKPWFSTHIKENVVGPLQIEKIQEGLNGVHEHTASDFKETHHRGLPSHQFNFQVAHSLEYLAKCFSYHAIHDSSIKVSVLVNKKLQLVSYQAEEIPMWMGYSAFGLTPKDNPEAPPIILFKGTSPYPSAKGAGITTVEDINPLGAGYFLYSFGASNIQNWLKEKTKKCKALVCGHSLGGALASYTTVNESERISQGYSFNGPGVSFFTAKKWNQLQNRPDLFNFNHPQDIVPKLRPTRIGTDYLVYTDPEQLQPKKWMPERQLDRHLAPLFEHSNLIVEIPIKTPIPHWVQIPVLTPIYFVALSILFTFRLIFGHSTAKPYHYVLGPVDWALSKGWQIIDGLWHKALSSERKKN